MLDKLNVPWWAWFLLITCVSVFTKLGFWQWGRADEKISIMSSYEQRDLKPVTLQPKIKFKQHQAIKANGKFDNRRVFLLDNRFYQHRFGYDVLTPYKIAPNQYVLVDRGWVEAAGDRRNLPQIEKARPKESLAGTVYYPSSKAWSLGDAIENKKGWPKLLEKIDFPLLEKALGVKLYPFILRLDSNDPNAFVRDWRVVTMTPAKHRGYAFQWWSFALATLVIFVILSLRQ